MSRRTLGNHRDVSWGARSSQLADRNPLRVSREVLALTFRGSRAELELAAALRLEAAVVLLFLAVRCVHLGQAGVDLALAGHLYTFEWLAVGLGAACVAESVVFALLTLGARRLTERAVLADAAFGTAGLALMSVASSSGPARAGSLNWMLPYTVATATALGVLAIGRLAPEPARAGEVDGCERASSRSIRLRLWPLGVVVGLAAAYVLSASLPRLVGGDDPGQIWGDAANYLVFFAAGGLTAAVTRRQVVAMSARNADATAAAASVAREGQWRAVLIDVFGPVLELLDRVVDLDDGELPASVRQEADRLIAMIDAVRPGDAAGSFGELIEARE